MMENFLWILLLFGQLALAQVSKDCGPPPRYPDRHVLGVSQVRSEHKVTYKCALGHTTASGSRFSYCRNGRWTPLSLTCKRKLCGSAGEIENGRYNQDGNLFGDKAVAECNEGFVLLGEPVRLCLDNGWNGTVPTCVVPKLCFRQVRSYLVLNETKDTHKPGEVLAVGCNAGFKLNASTSSVVCQVDGTWKPALRCEKALKEVTCPDLNVPNSVVRRGDVSPYRAGDQMKVQCEENFTLEGPAFATCGANGQWLNLPQCRPAKGTGKCGRPQSQLNALPREEYLDQESFESGAVVRFSCSHGYRWAGGSNRIFCVDDRWTLLKMRCEKKRCGSAGELDNGRYHYTGVSFGDKATAECNEGYHLVGVGVRYCRAEGWDSRPSICEVVQCPRPPAVPGAEMTAALDDVMQHLQLVSYRCRSGFLVGSAEMYCTQHGNWSAEPPKCIDVSCPRPSVTNGMQVFGFKNRYQLGHKVLFACNGGYRMLGQHSLTCTMDGKWKPHLPKCIRK